MILTRKVITSQMKNVSFRLYEIMWIRHLFIEGIGKKIIT